MNLLVKMTRDQYLTSSQVAALLRVNPKTVARWAKEGRISHTLTLGGHHRYSKEYILELCRSLESTD